MAGVHRLVDADRRGHLVDLGRVVIGRVRARRRSSPTPSPCSPGHRRSVVSKNSVTDSRRRQTTPAIPTAPSCRPGRCPDRRRRPRTSVSVGRHRCWSPRSSTSPHHRSRRSPDSDARTRRPAVVTGVHRLVDADRRGDLVHLGRVVIGRVRARRRLVADAVAVFTRSPSIVVSKNSVTDSAGANDARSSRTGPSCVLVDTQIGVVDHARRPASCHRCSSPRSSTSPRHRSHR